MSVRLHKWTTKAGETRQAYLVQYSTAELDSRGKRRRHTKFFAKKKDADAFEAQVRVDIGKGVHVPSSKSITVAEAGEHWLRSCADLERTTLDGYRAHLREHINPYLGGVKLSALTVALVRDWQDKLRNGTLAPGQAQGKPRSSDMVKRCTTSLGSLIADAQERGQVATNVVRSLKATRTRKAERRANGKLKVGVDIPTPEEIDAILHVVKGRWRPFLLVAIRCGLRASELRGLRWEDVDLKKGELHVRQRADAYNAIGQPKSEAGERTIPIPPTTLQTLREWKIANPKKTYVFGNGVDRVESHGNIINRGLVPTLIAAGVTVPVMDDQGVATVDEKGKPLLTAKYTGLHCLRHYFASWCIARPPVGPGLTLKELQVRLGHSNIGLTADTYSHLLPRADESATLAGAEGRFG